MKKFKPIDEIERGKAVLRALERYRDVANYLDKEGLVDGSYNYFQIDLIKRRIVRRSHPFIEKDV